jgi:hypothetical protein
MIAQDPNLEMSPRAFAIGMTVLVAYLVTAFSLIFYALTYSPNFAVRSAVLIKDPEPAVKVEIEYKEVPDYDMLEAEIGIWAPDGPPYHMQEMKVQPAPGTTETYLIPLDAENSSRLRRRSGSDPFEIQFHWGSSRYVRFDIDE